MSDADDVYHRVYEEQNLQDGPNDQDPSYDVSQQQDQAQKDTTASINQESLLKMKSASHVLVQGKNQYGREVEYYTETIPEMLEKLNKYSSDIKV